MTAIVTSLLASGGWGLVAGWILPAALNSALFGLLVLPAWRYLPALHGPAAASATAKALALLVAAVVLGLVLSALQTPLYRILEGYTWPVAARRWGIRRQLSRRRMLRSRLTLAQLVWQDQLGELTGAQHARLARYWPGVAAISRRRVQSWEVALLSGAVQRYPIDRRQVLPTRLGNAIRRFEEYPSDRYALDLITMWYALLAVVPEEVRRQVATSRAGVDFFICLIYGHVVVAVISVATLVAVPGHAVGPAVAFSVAGLLIFLWYQLAVTSTDEWAAAVRALVDVGRKPLAEALSLGLPPTLDSERQMWDAASRLGRLPYASADVALDRFRAGKTAAGGAARHYRRVSRPPGRGGAPSLLPERDGVP